MSKKKTGRGQTQQQNYTSLFSCAGIGEFYLKDLGFVAKVSNEKEPLRAKWYQEIYPEAEMVCGDITDPVVFERLVKLHQKHKCKGVMASPPCQSYAVCNNYRNPSDARGHLFEPTLEFIRRTEPEWVIIENAEQMLTIVVDGKIVVGEHIIETLKSWGYFVDAGIQDSANFYVPQHRRRTVILARKNKPWLLPTPTNTIITLRDAIGDLPSLEAGEHSALKWHYAPNWAAPQIEVMKHTPTGCSAHDNPDPWKPVTASGAPSGAKFKCSFSRKKWDEPSGTILKDSRGVSGFRNCHPGRLLPDGTYSDARPLTILELLRITGLPDDYPIPAWASETLIRAMFGECFATPYVREIFKGLK